MFLLMSEADIAADPIMATLFLTTVGAAAAALGGSVRSMIWHRQRRYKKIIPAMCAALSVLYVTMSINYPRLDGEWLIFGLCVMITLNAILIVDGLLSTGGHHHADK